MNDLPWKTPLVDVHELSADRPKIEARQDGGRLPAVTETRNLREPVAPPRGRERTLRGQRRTTREGPSAEAYAAMVGELKAKYKISIRKWRTHMSGVAYELTYADGRIKRLISAPRPRSPVSAAIFLHEVGHHAVGF